MILVRSYWLMLKKTVIINDHRSGFGCGDWYPAPLI